MYETNLQCRCQASLYCVLVACFSFKTGPKFSFDLNRLVLYFDTNVECCAASDSIQHPSLSFLHSFSSIFAFIFGTNSLFCCLCWEHTLRGALRLFDFGLQIKSFENEAKKLELLFSQDLFRRFAKFFVLNSEQNYKFREKLELEICFYRWLIKVPCNNKLTGCVRKMYTLLLIELKHHNTIQKL